MGCGQSQNAVSPQSNKPMANHNAESLPKEQVVENDAENITPRKKKKKNVLKDKAKSNQSGPDENANTTKEKPLEIVPKPVAFDVDFGGENAPGRRPSLPRRLSSRLSLLPSLENAPTLTYDMLLDKQKLAEEKRSRQLDKNKKLSRKSSKRRLEIMKAKEFEKEQQSVEMTDKEKLAEEKRLAKLEEVREKQRIREDRARRAREKVRRMSELPAEEATTVEVEKDDTFNKDDDVDSWLNDDGDAFNEDPEDRLRKKPRDDSGNYSIRGLSASTTDSFDYAFQRKPPLPNQNGRLKEETANSGAADDFFDS